MSEQSTISYSNAKRWQLILWPGNTTINSLLYVLLMFISYIAVGGYGIAVATAGLIATYTRIFDGITDPLIAVFTDRLETRFGKIRIIMLLGYVIQIGAILVLFSWGIGQGIVFYTVMYLIYYIGSTFSGIATNTGNTVLTNNPKQRPQIYKWTMIYTTILSTFSSIYLSKVLFAKYGSISIEALQELCYTLVAISVVLFIMAFIAIKDKDKPEFFPKKKNGKINFKDAWLLIKNNRGLQALIIAGTSDKLAQQAAGQAVITTIIFGIIIGNYSFFGTVNLISLVPTILVLIFGTKMAVKKGTKKALIRWTSISVVLAACMIMFMALIDPKQISVAPIQTTIFVILAVGFSAAMLFTSACTQAMKPDIVDYELYKTGNYLPGTVAAVYAFIDKFVSSFGSTIVALCIASIGYVSVQPQPGDTATTAIFWMGMFLWMGLPIIGFSFTYLAMKFYPLDKETMEDIQNKNQNIMNSNKGNDLKTVNQ